MKRKFMMLFAFLLMTGFGLCSIDANNVKKENQNGMSDVVNDQKTFETEADKILKEDTVKKEEPKKEVISPKATKPVKYNYDIGNCDKLYDSEAKTYAVAEVKFNDFSDPDKYVSNYMVYSTCDKWLINYYYEHY